MSSFLETIKAVDGEIFNISYHQARYESVLKEFGVKKYQNLMESLSPPDDGLYRCRLVYNEKKIDVSYHKYKKRDIKSLKLVYDDDIEYCFKSTNREAIDLLYEKRASCDDVIIVKNSFITDTSIANIALYKEGVWHTPRNPLLQGTTRTRLLKMNKLVESDIHVDEIYEYSKVALLNAMIDFDIIQEENIRKIIC